MSNVSKDDLITDHNQMQNNTFQKVTEKPPLPHDPSEDCVDPRVQVELEKLNTATDLINKLEIELDDARANFRLLLTESSQRINQTATKLGNCIDRGRPYYEARMRAKELQHETQKAALKFERASSAHSAAKEMVRLSEEGLCTEGRVFDPAWQEMLNHATMKVNEAEAERRVSKAAHQRMSQAYNAAEQNVQQLHLLLKKSIVKSRPYFEMKAQFNQLLEEQKRKVHSLEENVLRIKMGYSEALHNLEKISDEIHNRRKLRSALACNNHNKNNTVAADTVDAATINKIENVHSKCNGDSKEADNHSNRESKENVVGNHSNKESKENAVGNHSNASPKSFDLPLQKVSLAEMEEMTPMTPSGLLFSPLGATSSNKTEQIEAWCSSQSAFNVPKLSQLAQKATKNKEGLLGYGTPLRSVKNRDDLLSDNESLASTDTADTLDDHHIECLMLDRVLEQDYQDILASTSDLLAQTP